MSNEGITGQVKWYRRNKHLRIDGSDGGLPVHGGRGAGQHKQRWVAFWLELGAACCGDDLVTSRWLFGTLKYVKYWKT
jgi:hypothetical protein